ncbi:MAG TPA: phage holin family protein [Solirubrobacteraceae bacterium]|nr:phage holin family protein [Solirubrobacteraceae bacterium]
MSDGSSGGSGGAARGRADGMPGGPRAGGPQNIATAITDVSERFAALVHEEIELAKAEVSEKTGKLARGAIVAVAAGVFLVTALFFTLVGFALLIYYALPVGAFAYFWGFFAMAAILIVLGILAGLVAARVVKRGAPPTPQMAIEEARRIRESIGSMPDGGAGAGQTGGGYGQTGAG